MMLAAQPLNRLADKAALPSKSLIWRAILQVILRENIPDISFKDHHVGRIASKSKDFIDYVRKAIKKMEKKFEISDDKILEYYNHYHGRYLDKLNCFYQFRSLFAPTIEAVILLDRLVYLEEHPSVAKSSLVRLFDPSVSPRCYALIADKS